VTNNTSTLSLLKLEAIETHLPWQAALLPIAEFPVPMFQLETFNTFFRALGDVLAKEYSLSHELFYQVWKLSPQTGANILSDHLQEWPINIGLGIWPDRQPPQGWSEDRMVDAAAAVFRGDEPELPAHRLLHLTAEEEKRKDAAGKMRGFAAQIECFSQDAIDTILSRGKELFLPTIKERQYKRANFYLPLLDRKSIGTARSAEQLDEWMCGVDVYLRESAEDKGILVLSKINLELLLDKTRQKLSEEFSIK
jgi:hypothetical protein